MASRLNPYLTFESSCREAMEFYQSVLGGTLEISTFGDMDPTMSEGADLVMHSSLETEAGYTLYASDTPPGMDAPGGAGMSVSISGDEEERLRGYWKGLTEGAEIAVPLEKQMWGDVFGMFTDRFGTPWLINIAGDAG